MFTTTPADSDDLTVSPSFLLLSLPLQLRASSNAATTAPPPQQHNNLVARCWRAARVRRRGSGWVSERAGQVTTQNNTIEPNF